MARPWRIRFAGAKYHVTSRGNGRARIFLCEADYCRFLDQLAAALEADRVLLHAYCLMPNHIHLYLETPHANLPRFVQRLMTAYSMYFRYKKHRPGHCFQGRYGAKLVQGDDYQLRLTRYIHLNPVCTRAWEKATADAREAELARYPWSSYRSYAGLAPEVAWLDYRTLKLMGCPTPMGNQTSYRQYVEGFLGRNDDELQQAMTASRYAIGDERFREEIDERLRGVQLQKADTGDIAWPVAKTVPLDAVIATVARRFKVKEDDLRAHGRRLGAVKAVAVELCCRFGEETQRDVARAFGYRDASSVGKQRQALKIRLAKDPTLKRRMAATERELAGLHS